MQVPTLHLREIVIGHPTRGAGAGEARGLPEYPETLPGQDRRGVHLPPAGEQGRRGVHQRTQREQGRRGVRQRAQGEQGRRGVQLQEQQEPDGTAAALCEFSGMSRL